MRVAGSGRGTWMLLGLGAVLLFGAPRAAAAGARPEGRRALAVPIVEQARERCGQAALEMVLRYYGAQGPTLREADRAYDPALRGSLITDLAAAARRAGFEAEIATLTPDSLVALINAGVPPIVLYQGGRPPITTGHYGVITAWDQGRSAFTLQDGTARPRAMRREDLVARWKTAGSRALIVRRRAP